MASDLTTLMADLTSAGVGVGQTVRPAVALRRQKAVFCFNLVARFYFFLFQFDFSLISDGTEENGAAEVKDAADAADEDRGGSDSASMTSGLSDRDVTLPTLEPPEPESNG